MSLSRMIALFERVVIFMAALGGVIVLIQMVWISYGVFTRYAMNAPDRMVTEATALLLFPVAFAGLAYALREDAYPRVTMLTDRFRPAVRKGFALLNMGLMLAVGLFFSLAAIKATTGAFKSGASSEILLWPRYAFWAPGAAALILFSIYAALRLARLVVTPASDLKSEI